MSQPPTSKYPDMGEVTTLRLELCRERDRANAFEAALKTDVLKVAKVAIYQASIDAGKAADADTIGCMGVEVDDLKAENARLKAEVERLKDTKAVVYADRERLLVEVERLRASSFVTAVPVEEYEKLKAEVERLKAIIFLHRIDFVRETIKEPQPEGWNSAVAKAVDLLAEKCKEIERLRKAGDLMSDHLAHEFGTCPSIEIWNAAKEGKQP